MDEQVYTDSIDLHFPSAVKLTTWWLSAKSAANDMLQLNGKNLTVAVDAPLPSLDGVLAAATDITTVPALGVCKSGFVQAEYSEPLAACM